MNRRQLHILGFEPVHDPAEEEERRDEAQAQHEDERVSHGPLPPAQTYQPYAVRLALCGVNAPVSLMPVAPPATNHAFIVLRSVWAVGWSVAWTVTLQV